MEELQRAPGLLLRDARTRARLSQKELARRAGVAQSVISAYESGHRDPSLKTLSRLIQATGHNLLLNLESDPLMQRGLPDSPMGGRIRQRRSKILAIAARHQATNLRVFGSVARGDDHNGSDIDIAADLRPGMGLFEFGTLERELSDAMGVRVDLVPNDGLRREVREIIDKEAVPL
jgi:uncharacterized protein